SEPMRQQEHMPCRRMGSLAHALRLQSRLTLTFDRFSVDRTLSLRSSKFSTCPSAHSPFMMRLALCRKRMLLKLSYVSLLTADATGRNMLTNEPGVKFGAPLPSA